MGFAGDLYWSFECDKGAVVIVSKVIGVSIRKFGPSFAPVSFECHEDVAALPVPVQVVEVRVERMIGCVLGGIGVVRFLVRPDVERDRVIGARGNIRDGETWACVLDETDSAGLSNGAAIHSV